MTDPSAALREPQSQFRAVNTRTMASDCWFSNRMHAGEGDQFMAPEFGFFKIWKHRQVGLWSLFSPPQSLASWALRSFVCCPQLVPKLLLLQQMLCFPPTLCSYFSFNIKPVADRSGKTDWLKDHEEEWFHQREAQAGPSCAPLGSSRISFFGHIYFTGWREGSVIKEHWLPFRKTQVLLPAPTW